MNDHSVRFLTGLVGFFNFLAVATGKAGELHEPPVTGVGEVSPRNPVLLIHGIRDSAASMRTMGKWLASQGREVHTFSMSPSDGSLPLPELAQQVSRYVRKTFTAGQKIDLVGFSMGGVVCRYYLQRLGGVERVERFVAISAPNHGSWLAYASNKPGCVQMRPGSAFLRELDAGMASLATLQLTTLWTPLDLTILPAKSSRLRMGKEVRMWVVLHPLMVRSRQCLRVVAQALETNP